MDGGIALAPEEIKGRNAWNLWTAGNQHFWNTVAQDSFGLMDLLKSMDNRKYKRGERFKVMGLMNQPGFRAPTKPDEFGLWLDEPTEPEPAGIDEKIYGKAHWRSRVSLVPKSRIHRGGAQEMGRRALHDRPELLQQQPAHSSLSRRHFLRVLSHRTAADQSAGRSGKSALGKSRLRDWQSILPRRESRLPPNVEKGGFFYEMLQAQPPGTSDTSRIATDHLNNPNAVNAIFLLAERERIAHTEKLAGGTLALPGTKAEMPVPRISEGRRGFHRRAGRDDSRLHQHRDVLRILADAA